ncbi:MAG: TetR/AcrR family transcriptional regulator [Novosphingobium sp.]
MPKRTPAAPALAVDNVSRKPLQGRSKASLERMLKAAQELMEARGNEDFTLQDVSKTGDVSIGSIYLRFESKENLVRAVIANHLEHIMGDEARMFAKINAASRNLREFVTNFVASYAEFLRQHAPMMRLSMARAQHDALVSEPGKAAASRAARLATEGMFAYTNEFGGDDREVRASAAFDVIFSTLARHLALGSSAESANELDWEILKTQLARMCLAFLTHKD